MSGDIAAGSIPAIGVLSIFYLIKGEKKMTFREKLMKEHPNKVGMQYEGCCCGCPHHYGYEKQEDRPCAKGAYDCTICWGRAIPAKKSTITFKEVTDRDRFDVVAYLLRDTDAAKEMVARVQLVRPTIKSVKFNPPATIIFWTDGTKTVVKCQEGDFYNAETGFALAYLKKLLGNDNTFNKEITKWVPEELTDNEPIHDPLEDINEILMQVNGVNPNKVTKRQLLCIIEEAARTIQKTWEGEENG